MCVPEADRGGFSPAASTTQWRRATFHIGPMKRRQPTNRVPANEGGRTWIVYQTFRWSPGHLAFSLPPPPPPTTTTTTTTSIPAIVVSPLLPIRSRKKNQKEFRVFFLLLKRKHPFTEFYRVSHRVDSLPPIKDEIYRVLPSYTGFYLVLSSFTGFDLVLLGFT